MLQLDKATDEIIFLMSTGNYVGSVKLANETLNWSNRQRKGFVHSQDFHRFAINAAAASRMALDRESFCLFVRLANKDRPIRITRQYMTNSHLEIMEIITWCYGRPRVIPDHATSMLKRTRIRLEETVDRFFTWQDTILANAKHFAAIQMQILQLTSKPVV